jgi:hypothetical protein
MLELLGSIPGANLDVIRTFESGTDTLDPHAFDPPQACFVDCEHTEPVCERHADFCRRRCVTRA